MENRGKTISYSSYKAKENKRTIHNRKNLKSYSHETNQEELTNLQEELQSTRSENMQVLFVRSMLNWIQSEEKLTKDFCNLVNQHYTDKSFPFLQQDDGTLMYDQHQTTCFKLLGSLLM